ncbi:MULTISPECIES: hypothetical protein [unclassified Mesorhizobium]|uniref:hypothetical protein n=1 Tax=unclassified Mesorhizobium TaxID=325217 RepID=UPI002414E52B|nr:MULTISPECIES: hypothetical protein [unclassified Mesorhizobium]MDG4852265.1 hypothetical protein [Mesorhizobium sp. WSM4982]MDG4911023.1 hypothetical protein [Mesorhizobium sp. WSM4983]
MKWIVAGWLLLFIVSALFFIAAAWRDGDLLALAAAFLPGCLLFVPRSDRGPKAAMTVDGKARAIP